MSGNWLTAFERTVVLQAQNSRGPGMFTSAWRPDRLAPSLAFWRCLPVPGTGDLSQSHLDKGAWWSASPLRVNMAYLMLGSRREGAGFRGARQSLLRPVRCHGNWDSGAKTVRRLPFALCWDRSFLKGQCFQMFFKCGLPRESACFRSVFGFPCHFSTTRPAAQSVHFECDGFRKIVSCQRRGVKL